MNNIESSLIGKRVVSRVAGLYFGTPGTVIKRAQMQYGSSTRYIVELDNGVQIVLPEHHMRILEKDA